MSDRDDAAPFLVLQNNGEEFMKTFQRDIDDCICTLNSKITSLICEPEILSSPFGDRRQSGSARTEFAKSKYDVFLSVQKLFTDMEDKWMDSIAEMKKTFLESVELFLAGTKLEVKFPSSTELARLGTKISPLPKEKKSANSIYPSLHDIEDTFLSPRRDGRRKTYSFKDSSGSPALNLSPLKQNLCDIEEEEFSDSSENMGEFLQDEGMHITSERSGRTSFRRKSNQDNRVEDISEDEDMHITPERSGKTSFRRKSNQDKRIEEISEDEGMGFAQDKVVRTNFRRKNSQEKRVDDHSEGHQEQYFPNKINTRKRSLNVRPGAPELYFLASDLSFPEENARTNPRRKTMHAKLADNDLSLESDFMPERTTRTKAKRRTICQFIEDKNEPSTSAAAPSPKRVKRSGSLKNTKSALAASNTPGKGFSLMDCDEAVTDKTHTESPSKHQYSNWASIQSITDTIPKSSGVYELKVWRAKKTAYIGCSENLLHQLFLHKKMQNSGHKHLDKFLERNVNDVQVRFEVSPSLSDAKLEAKNRIKEFVDKYKTTPAYN